MRSIYLKLYTILESSIICRRLVAADVLGLLRAVVFGRCVVFCAGVV